MNTTTTGIVIREKSYHESDRLIKILTSNGLVTAYAKAANNIKSKKFSATAQFCYSDFLLFNGSDMYIVKEAAEKEVFFALRQDVEKLSLALYFSEVIESVTPEITDTADILRLLLNSLHCLCKTDKKIELVKLVFELRLMCLLGFMPDVSCCCECGKFPNNVAVFDIDKAKIYCSNCSHTHNGLSVIIGEGELSVMRYIIESDFSKIFSFTASDTALANVSAITEKYVERRTERHFKTLDYYKSVRITI